jgi:NADPH-dependent 2,4-dienoyl-CoA reductase/sulfur reductase-like enzyme
MKNLIPDFSWKKKGRKIVIIGNGIAGITCARNIRKEDDNAIIQVISGESEYFFSRTALMYIYMGHMKFEHTKPYEDWFWKKNKIELVHDWVAEIDFQSKNCLFQSGNKIPYDLLILATGSKPLTFGWPGLEHEGVQGLYSKQDLELMEMSTQETKKAVVVGGGLIGIEMVEMLKSRKIAVTFLVRESGFWELVLPKEEFQMVERHMLEHGVDLRLNTELKEIIADDKGKVKGVLTLTNEMINCEFVGIATGVTPNIDFLVGSQLELNKGILVDEFFSTSIEDVYAIGDCAEFRKSPAPDRKEVEQVWYTGRMHGETLAHNLTHKKVPYRPGPWFNSAKFFDLEYQTYGIVPNRPRDGIDSFVWQHENGRILFRAVYTSESRIFIGANSLGFRLRHEFMDKAIKEKWKIDKVMDNLDQADFNPEFYEKHHKKILAKFNGFKAGDGTAKERNLLL